MTLRITASTLKLVFILFICISSMQTLLVAIDPNGLVPNWPVFALASVEVAAILAFAVERWQRTAAILLVIIFAIAFAGTAMEGEFAPRFIFFAATALYLAGVDYSRNVSQEQSAL